MLLGLCNVVCAQTVSVQLDPLYWNASESIDWAALNDMQTPNQTITYKTIGFNYSPGYRLGINYKNEAIDTSLYYTSYFTKISDGTTGNITSAFLAARIASPNTPYQAEQILFGIDYNTIDWDIGKGFQISDRVNIHPIVGLRGAWINQSVKTSLQGSGISVTENLVNDFTGIGPKTGVSTDIMVWKNETTDLSIIANFDLAYLAGYWVLKDLLHHNNPSSSDDININLGNRHQGALATQAQIGGNLHYQQMNIGLVYEINDWFDQAQFFDNATGAHNNDLVLQGLTLNLRYAFL